MSALKTVSPYTGVSTFDREIRLIELLPGDFHDPIECKFQTTHLNLNVAYDAVSYTWGTSDITKPVTVNSLEIQTMPNLESALRHLRKSNEPRLIWVDALCINQENSKEKTHQVKLMGDIYRTAKRCLLWLGDFESLGLEEQEGEEFVRFFEGQSRGEHIFQKPFDQVKFFRGLRKFLSSPWWQRVWTVQEIMLPAERTVIMGKLNIPWDWLVKGRHGTHYHSDNCCKAAWNEVGKKEELHDQHYMHLFWWYIDSVAHQLPHLCVYQKESPLTNLWSFRMREASDPRGKVLGLLGLSSSWSPRMENIDYYSLDTDQVYQQASISLMELYKGLQPMIFARPQSKNSKYPTMASWAIDWEMWEPAANWEIWIHTLRYLTFNANKGLGLKLQEHSKEGAISLSGIYIDKIIEVCPPLEGTVDPRCRPDDPDSPLKQWYATGKHEFFSDLFVEQRPHWIKHLQEVSNKYRSSDGVYVGGGTFEDAFWRTLVGDMIVEPGFALPTRRAAPKDGKMLETYLEGEDSGPLLKSIRDMTSCQAFFITDRGYMGFGPRALEKGDELWVLCGGRVPFALREFVPRKTVTEMENVKTRVTLGDCYVHGVMDGEAMTEYAEKEKLSSYTDLARDFSKTWL